MTVPIVTSQSLFTGNGVTTVFNAGFYFLDDDEVVVRITPLAGVEVIKTKGVHYTVQMPAGVGLNGGITMLVAPAVNDAIVIERTVPVTQVMSLRQQGSFSPAIHEDAFDQSVFRDQQLARRISALESAGAAGSVVAGNGLAFVGATIHVGAGTGIQANADTIEVLFGVAADVADVTKAAEAAGVGVTAARIDHKHDVSTAAAGAIAIGDAAAEGAATSLARSDHRHSLAAPAVPANVTKAAASAGVATTVARADHKHDVTTAAAVSLTDAANAEGVATSLARSDHTHGHGARAGGTLHANAVAAGAAGFMTGADKTLLDALAATRTHVRADRGTAQTLATGVASTIVFTVAEYDTLTEFSTSTGILTAINAGYYHVNATVMTQGVLLAVGVYFVIYLEVSGTIKAYGNEDKAEAATTRELSSALSAVVYLTAGQTIRIKGLQNAAATLDTTTTSGRMRLTIDRL